MVFYKNIVSSKLRDVNSNKIRTGSKMNETETAKGKPITVGGSDVMDVPGVWAVGERKRFQRKFREA